MRSLLLRGHISTGHDPKALPSFLRLLSSSFQRKPSKEEETNAKGRWLKLPPFSSHIDPTSVARSMTAGDPPGTSSVTALKWVRRCCPTLPVTLLQKLFRLRQVRRQVACDTGDSTTNQTEGLSLKRVSAKDEISRGDVILLPRSVQELSPHKDEYCCNKDEEDFVHGLELHKDAAIVVLNKPHGIPVQGGVGINLSVDKLAAKSLRYDYKEPPRLVHRLDKDSSGVLVLGRTQTSASILHSIFREKTFGASADNDRTRRILQRKYWALVIGKPRRSSGIISAPLAKVVLENGKAEIITVSNGSFPSQTALTEYKVLGSSSHGYTWLELCPLTGRKHQLRVHCSEVLGTPIVGDYKYGWQAHRKWEPVPSSPVPDDKLEKPHKLPFGLDPEGHSISDKQPWLHLHCRQMVLPDISKVIKSLTSSDRQPDFSKLEFLDLVAPMPSHMLRSWNALNL